MHEIKIRKSSGEMGQDETKLLSEDKKCIKQIDFINLLHIIHVNTEHTLLLFQDKVKVFA